MDAPFTVHLAQKLTRLVKIEHGKGYGCVVMLVDSSTGMIEVLRLISFSTKFSRKLKENIETQIESSFNEKKYDSDLNRIFRTYSTKDMVNSSKISCYI